MTEADLLLAIDHLNELLEWETMRENASLNMRLEKNRD